MRRHYRFLFLATLFLLSCIIAYFLSGCAPIEPETVPPSLKHAPPSLYRHVTPRPPPVARRREREPAPPVAVRERRSPAIAFPEEIEDRIGDVQERIDALRRDLRN